MVTKFFITKRFKVPFSKSIIKYRVTRLEERMKNTLKPLLIAILLLFSVPGHSQEGVSESDIFVDRESKYTKSLLRIIDDLKKTIEVRLEDIEKKHSQLVMLRPEYKNKHTIVTEDIPFTIDEGYDSNLLKYISFQYDGGKIKQIEIGSRKKRIHYEFAFENKTMVIDPTDILKTEVILTRFDQESKTRLSGISLDNQIRALRLVEASLRNAFYRMDVMIVLIKERRDRENEYQIDI